MGVIPRAVRGGNPLQVLNPFASAQYGSAEENTVMAQTDPSITHVATLRVENRRCAKVRC